MKCVGYRGIFRLPSIGNIGGRPVDRHFIALVDARARAIVRACERARDDTGTGKVSIDPRQMKLEDIDGSTKTESKG